MGGKLAFPWELNIDQRDTEGPSTGPRVSTDSPAAPRESPGGPSGGGHHSAKL